MLGFVQSNASEVAIKLVRELLIISEARDDVPSEINARVLWRCDLSSGNKKRKEKRTPIVQYSPAREALQLCSANQLTEELRTRKGDDHLCTATFTSLCNFGSVDYLHVVLARRKIGRCGSTGTPAQRRKLPVLK